MSKIGSEVREVEDMTDRERDAVRKPVGVAGGKHGVDMTEKSGRRLGKA